MWPRRDSFKMMWLLEKVIYENLLSIFYLFPNIYEWYSWWYGLFAQFLYHVQFGWWWYWGALALDLIVRYNIVSNYWVSLSKEILFFAAMIILYVYTARMDLYILQIQEKTAWSDKLLIILTAMKIDLSKSYFLKYAPPPLYWFNRLSTELFYIS